MANEVVHLDSGDALYFAESVRLLWDGARRVVYGGIDTSHLAALCSIVAQVSESRLSLLKAAPHSTDSDKAIQLLCDIRIEAQELLASAETPTPEPDWSAIGEKLASVGAAPLELQE